MPCTGNYPHAETVAQAAPSAEPLFSWSRLEDVVKWFFDLGAALSSYEAHLQAGGFDARLIRQA